MTALGRGMTVVGAGMAAGLYVAGKSAMDFETAMKRIQTQAGASASQVDSMTKAVLKLGGSGQVQYGPKDLANALYHIESVSSGVYPQLRNTATAMSVLKVAAQGAAIGGSNLEDTTTALMGVMVAAHIPLSQAQQTMALMNATVGVGNMRMQDLVAAMGRGIIPAFINVGLTTKDAFAAIALFSDQGTKASSSAAQLATSLHYLASPSKNAQKYLAYMGMSQYQLTEDLQKPQGLLVALKDLKAGLDRLGVKSPQSIQAMFAFLPGGRGRILQQALNNLDQYSGKLGALYASTGKFQADYAAQSNTAQGRLQTAWAKIQTSLTTFGATILPIVEKILPTFTNAITKLLKAFTGLNPIFKQFFVYATLGLLVFGPLFSVFGRLLTFIAKIRDAWIAVRGAATAAAAAETIAGAAGGAGGAAGAAGGAAGAASRIPTSMAPLAEAGAGGMATTAGAAGGFGLAALGTAAVPLTGLAALAWLVGHSRIDSPYTHVKVGNRIVQVPRNPATTRFGILGAHGGLVTPDGIRRYQMGGPVYPDVVPAYLSAGEGVLNRAAMAGIGTTGLAALNSGAGMGNVTIQPAPVYLYLDGRNIARSVIAWTVQRGARGPSSLIGGSLMTGTGVPVQRS